MDLEKIQAHRDEQQAVADHNQEKMDAAFALQSILDSQKQVENSIKQTLLGLVKYLNSYKPTVSVDNQQPFPSYDEVVSAVKDVVKEVKNSNKSLATVEQKEADYSTIIAGLDKIAGLVAKLPKPIDSVTVKNPSADYTKKFDEVKAAVESIDTKPIVNVPETVIPDNSEELNKIVKAVEKIKFPEIPKTDFSAVEQAVKGVRESIQALRFPVPNYVLPFKDSSGKDVQVQLNSDGSLPVDATINTGDIEIGAVEIKDSSTDDRTKVIATSPAGTEFGVVTRPIQAQLPTALTADGDLKTEIIESVPQTYTGSGASATTIIASTEVKGRWVSLQLTGIGTATVQLQWSNDNSTFVAGNMLSIANTTSPGSTSMTANGVYTSPVFGRYAKVVITAWTSGTVVATLEVWSTTGGQNSLGVQVNGTFTEDAAVSGGSAGVAILGQRNDTAAALTSADNDWGNIALDSAGRVGVSSLGGVLSTKQTTNFAVDSNNSTTSTLTASSTFTGTATDVSNYAEVGVEFYATPSTAQASLFIEFSPEGTNWDISIPYLITDPTYFIPTPLKPVAKFFRVRYLNDGGTAAIAAGASGTATTPAGQTAFRLNSYLYAQATAALIRTLDQTIKDNQPVNLGRNVIMGKSTDGTYHNFRADGTAYATSATLGSNASYTGAWFDALDYAGFAVIVKSDQASSSSGWVVQFSPDNGTTIVDTLNYTYTSADINDGIRESGPIEARYIRVTYQNGSVAQGNFFLQLSLTTTPAQIPLTSVEQGEASANIAIRGKEVLFAQDPAGGSYANVTRTPTDGSSRTGLHVGIMRFDADAPIKALTSWVTGQATISSTSTAVNVIPSPTSGRKTFAVKGLTSNTKVVFIGPASTVTTGNGWELAAGETLVVEIDTTTSVWVIGTTSTSQTVSFAEVI